MKSYTERFYSYNEKAKSLAAETILQKVFQQYPAIDSVVDVGCGTGLWLGEALKLGVREVFGFEGAWVNTESLVIPKTCFKAVDLNEAFIDSTQYDLAISLEVAEHLAPESATGFVEQLTQLSDRILFSAALPDQGGVNHTNEQWASYWVSLFQARGYALHDFIRPALWSDEDIPFYYRQNILFFSRLEEGVNESSVSLMPVDVVHPVAFSKANSPSIKTSLRLVFKALKRRFLG